MKINIGKNEDTENWESQGIHGGQGNQGIDYIYEKYRPAKTRSSFKSYYGNNRGHDYKWVFQLLVSGVILLVIAGLFKLNIPFTGPVKQAVKYLMNTETNVQPVFSKIVQIASQQGNIDWPLVDDIPQPAKNVLTPPESKSQAKTGPSMALPVSGNVTRLYGWTDEEGENVQVFHQGLDIQVPLGTEVKAAASGKVIKTGKDDEIGRYALLKGENGEMLRYANLAEVLVEVDETVKMGDLIGKTGETEQKKSHLHFEVIENGRPVDPLGKLGIDISSGTGAKQTGE